MSKKSDEFDPLDFLQRHLRVTQWLNERKISYSQLEIRKLCDLVTETFKSEPSLAELSPPCIVVGDIHGQYMDLIRILNVPADEKKSKSVRSPLFATQKYMFLGDYVDRGSHSLECICLVLCLKLVFPTQYILLRGNHETRTINFSYGFREELTGKFGEKDGMLVWEQFNAVFSFMPLAGLIGGRILCMHGGISKDLTSLDDIRKIKRPLKTITSQSERLPLDLLWADPASFFHPGSCENIGNFRENEIRGISCEFNETAVHEVCRRLDLKLIIRAHQVQQEGFEFFADHKLVTIFSAPNYMNEQRNDGAVLKVNANGSISVTILRTDKKKAADKLVSEDEFEERTMGNSKQDILNDIMLKKSGMPAFNRKKSSSFCRSSFRKYRRETSTNTKLASRYLRAVDSLPKKKQI